MQNMNQTTTLESATNTHLSARYPADNHHPSLRLSNPEEIFPREHQHLTSTQQNKDHNLIPFEGAQKKIQSKIYNFLSGMATAFTW